MNKDILSIPFNTKVSILNSNIVGHITAVTIAFTNKRYEVTWFVGTDIFKDWFNEEQLRVITSHKTKTKIGFQNGE